MIAKNYDPLKDIDPTAWLALDEAERIDAVSGYRRQRSTLPNLNIHVRMHVVVENQVALGDSYPAKAVLARLMTEGLDRHEAVHAIATVLSGQLFNALKYKDTAAANEYTQKLTRLTAESWRKQFS